ncbi:hypothetical protein FG379_001732 [Cryptosporidium bovis]|uniref:uncharacterized protein n=1 Tax=Cryptosporidium bovis TaxID=310047 RepID=UPI003519ECDF|nr:hypothetical protein FG379_001732 [Cryptosporidium bovis]
MNQLKESDTINEIPGKKSSIGIEQSSSHRITSAPSTTCVSPVLEGKPLTNNYLETLMLNCQNTSQQITPNPNIGLGINMGLGMNLNLGALNELNPGNPFILPNQLYRTNNLIGNLQGIIPDYYSSLLRGYNMNTLQGNFPLAVGNPGIQFSNLSGVESLLLNQGFMNYNEEKQSESSLKTDQHTNIINPLAQSQFLAINSQPALIPSNILPGVSSIATSRPGIVGQVSNLLQNSMKPTFPNSQDMSKNQKGVLIDQTKDQNTPEGLERLNNLIYSYINNINGLNDLNERVRNYLNTYNSDTDSRNIVGDSLKTFGCIGEVTDQSNNVKIDSTGKDNFSITSQRQIATAASENIATEQNDIFKLNQTRKYRLGDQGRALLKSELSAYLRCNPEKRIEASKIADIRNATTKQLWQIAAMCGLEERFINLHAQSLAQSRGKVNVRGTKRKSGNVNELSKLIGKNTYATRTGSKESVEPELFKINSPEVTNLNSNVSSAEMKRIIEPNVYNYSKNKLGSQIINSESSGVELIPATVSQGQGKVYNNVYYCNKNGDDPLHSIQNELKYSLLGDNKVFDASSSTEK